MEEAMVEAVVEMMMMEVEIILENPIVHGTDIHRRCNLIKQWKEWTLAVQAQVAGWNWNERFRPYWVSVLDKATAAYSHY
eukprot:1372312-Amphidinium_carterae.1